MGTGATSSAGGTVTAGSTKPVFQSGTSILMVTYQVQVTAAFGSTITTAGTFHYKSGSTTVNKNVTATIFAVSPFYACSSTGYYQLYYGGVRQEPSALAQLPTAARLQPM